MTDGNVQYTIQEGSQLKYLGIKKKYFGQRQKKSSLIWKLNQDAKTDVGKPFWIN